MRSRRERDVKEYRILIAGHYRDNGLVFNRFMWALGIYGSQDSSKDEIYGIVKCSTMKLAYFDISC
jgi:hypothetical protein